jgi:hypothetical protein
MAGSLTEEVLFRALSDMTLLQAKDTLSVEPLSDQDQHEAYKVCVAGRPMLVRSSSTDTCTAVHVYATTAAHHVPAFRPKILGCDEERGILVEEWLGEYKSLGQELQLESAKIGWSTPFRDDEFSEVDFESVLQELGATIGKVHARTAGPVQFSAHSSALANRAELPETYWRAVSAHPHLANRLRGIAECSARAEPVLLHGRLSPRSVLFKLEEAVAIVGTHHAAPGDPAFDLAHMMAHLFVVAVHHSSSILTTSAGGFHAGYACNIEGLDKLSIMYRAGPLTAAMMLAILQDERAGAFLTVRARQDVFDFSEWWLGRRDYTLGHLRDALWDAVDLGGVMDWRARFASLPRVDD